MLSRHQSPHVGRRPPVAPMNYYSNYHPQQGFMDDDDDDDRCSTCSSSSSDSDDPYAYELPQRKAYGGVRLSYVPNDRLRARHHQQRAIQSQQEYVSQRQSLRGGSNLQPQSLPPRHHHQPPQQPQQHYHQHQPQQQQHHHQPMHPQQPQHFAHQGPASGASSAGSKDKDKCTIS